MLTSPQYKTMIQFTCDMTLKQVMETNDELPSDMEWILESRTWIVSAWRWAVGIDSRLPWT